MRAFPNQHHALCAPKVSLGGRKESTSAIQTTPRKINQRGRSPAGPRDNKGVIPSLRRIVNEAGASPSDVDNVLACSVYLLYLPSTKS